MPLSDPRTLPPTSIPRALATIIESTNPNVTMTIDSGTYNLNDVLKNLHAKAVMQEKHMVNLGGALLQAMKIIQNMQGAIQSSQVTQDSQPHSEGSTSSDAQVAQLRR
jgi:hypothetical protein